VSVASGDSTATDTATVRVRAPRAT
jgi:hypothetical protein